MTMPAPLSAPTRKKSATLLVLTAAGWALALVFMGGPFLRILAASESLAQGTVLALLLGLLTIFWLLGAYYLAIVVLFFAGRLRPSPPSSAAAYGQLPGVAILYPTCDDFQRDAALTCLRQNYENFHVFLLDDSRSAESCEMVDCFHDEFPHRTTVIRRADRRGYKAGNLNHALHGAAAGYPLFAVMDADERIPANFLARMVVQLTSGDWAFVQASHAPNPDQSSAFARAMGQTILPFWEVLLASKNRYGFVPCVGHGLIAQHAAWRETGGFPEVVSEDLAFSARLLALGKRGYYLESVVCHEDFPPDLQSLRKQQRRYLSGVVESAWKFWPATLRASHISIVEKADFLLCCLPLYVPIFCLAFLVLLGLGMVAVFGVAGNLDLQVGGAEFSLPYIRTFDDRFRELWTPWFVAASVVFSLSPALPMLALALVGKIKQPIRLLVLSHLAYMSTMFVGCAGLLERFRRVPIAFSPTMSRLTDKAASRVPARWSLLVRVELVTCVVLALVLAATLNLGLAAVACCPLAARLASDRLPLLYCAGAGIFVGVTAQVLLSALTVASPFGFSQLVFSIHF